jgi:hypothetical protein
VAVEERDARKERKNSLTEDELETHRQVVELIAKHIEECEALEKKRYQSRVGGRGGAKTSAKGEIRRVAMETDLAPIEVDPELAQGLQQLQRNDEKLDEQLDVIAKGVQRLKGIAVDQSNEVKLQGVMIDQISDNMDKATDHLNDANTRLKETLEKAGGATSIIVKVPRPFRVRAAAPRLSAVMAETVRARRSFSSSFSSPSALTSTRPLPDHLSCISLVGFPRKRT